MDPCLQEISRADVLLVLHLHADTPNRRAAYGIARFLIEDPDKGTLKRPVVSRMLSRLHEDGYIEPDDGDDDSQNAFRRQAYRLKEPGAAVADKYAHRIGRLAAKITVRRHGTLASNQTEINE